MKLKFNKSAIFLVFLCTFFICSHKVLAEGYAKCWYSITNEGENLSASNPVTLYIAASNGNVTSEFKYYKVNTHGYTNYVGYNAKLHNIPFEGMKSIDDSNKLACPEIYYKKDATGTYNTSFKYEMSIYRNDIVSNDQKTMYLYNKEIVDDENSNNVSNVLSCPYYLKGKGTPSLVINIDGNSNVILPNGFQKKDFNDDLFANSCPSSIWIDFTSYNGSSSLVYTSKPSFITQSTQELTYKNSDLTPDAQYDKDGKINKNSKDLSKLELGNPLKCEDLKNTDTFKMIRQIFTWMQIIAPILLLIFGVIDFSKAVAASDDQAIKKAQKTFVKRLIMVAAIILLPLAFDLVFSFLDSTIGITTCGIGK